MAEYSQRLARGQSLESEATISSEDSGSSSLWFLPGVGSGSAGAAPPPPPPPASGMAMAGGQDFIKGDVPQKDLPMLDIDWVSLLFDSASWFLCCTFIIRSFFDLIIYFLPIHLFVKNLYEEWNSGTDISFDRMNGIKFSLPKLTPAT